MYRDIWRFYKCVIVYNRSFVCVCVRLGLCVCVFGYEGWVCACLFEGFRCGWVCLSKDLCVYRFEFL